MPTSQVVLPGDVVEGGVGRAGPGLECEPEGKEVRVCVAGILRRKAEEQTWVDFSRKRYVPVNGDRVLGIVIRTGRVHRVDIGAARSAILPELAFQGATKRNKPAIQVGEVVYTRVARAHKDIEPELSCVEASGKADGLGPLPPSHSGYVLHCSIGLCRKLLMDPCPVRQALGRFFKFECVVGMNGTVWINTRTVVHTIAIASAFTSSEYMSGEQCNTMVEKIIDTL